MLHKQHQTRIHEMFTLLHPADIAFIFESFIAYILKLGKLPSHTDKLFVVDQHDRMLAPIEN
jgi:hypothetical protein